MSEATQGAATTQVATQPLGTFDSALAAELQAMGVNEDGVPIGGEGGELVPYEGDEQHLVEGDGGSGEEGGEQSNLPAIQAGQYQASDGQTYNVPQELIDGNMRQADYTKGCQALAQRWEAANKRDAELAELFQTSGHMQMYRAALYALDSEAQQIHEYLGKTPTLIHDDPVKFGQCTGQLQLLAGRRQNVLGQAQQAIDKHAAYVANQTAERVSRVMPVFQQVGITPARLQSIASHFVAHGAPPDVMEYLHGANAPWAIVMGHKALAFDEMQAKRTQATNKVNQAQRAQVLRPGASSNTQRGTTVEKGRQRLGATGSVKDAVALELAIGEGRARGMQGRR